MCVQGTDDLLLWEAWPDRHNEDGSVTNEGNNKRYVRDKKERTICLISGSVHSLMAGKMGNPSGLDLSGQGTLLSDWPALGRSVGSPSPALCNSGNL